MVVCQPAAVWFPISSPRRAAHPRPARLDVPCILPGKQVQEDPGGRGPVRAPPAVSLHDWTHRHRPALVDHSAVTAHLIG